MAKIDIRTFIRASPEDVWAVISDLGGQQRWMVDVRRLEVISEASSGVGTVLSVTSDLFGLPVVRDVMEVTGWEPPREIAVVHRGQFSGSAVFRLEPVRGGTVFMWQEAFRPPLGALGELGHHLVVGPHLRRVFARSMDNVRRLVEGGGG